MSDVSPDAPTLDPKSAALSALPYEEFKSAREDKSQEPAADPTVETPVGAGVASDVESGATDAPVDASSVAGTTPARDASGQFTKKKGEKPRDNPKARIDELTAKQREAERRAEAAERRAAELEARFRTEPAEYKAPPPVRDVETRPRPVIDAFADQPDPYLAWQEALVDWKIEQRDAKIEQGARQRQHEHRARTYQERATEFAARTPDWEHVINNPALPALTPAMAEAILDSDRGPEIAYFLGSHPDQYVQLVRDSMNSGIEAAPMVRRYLESVIPPALSPAAATPTGTAQAIRHSRAALPPTPVGNGALTAHDGSPGKESVDGYVLRRNREELQRRGLR